MQYVLPAIKEKWPESDRWNTVYIQQDNARTHVLANDPIFAMEAAKGGWDIRIVNQPPNSPDCNILDQACMREIIKHKGSMHYDTPHMKKKTLERLGLLSVRLMVDKDYVDAAIEYLNSP